MVWFFDPVQIVRLIRQLDPTRLIDTDSGGPANSLRIADVNDMFVCCCVMLLVLMCCAATTTRTQTTPSRPQRSMP